MKLTPDEQTALAAKIEELYFHQNFGSLSKADFELLLFSEFIEHCLTHDEPFDDYTLSKELGISQARIRTLKERKELKYPHKGFAWKKAFAESVKDAKYDKSDHYIKMIIQDVNVMNEARHYIEEHGWYDECSLNRKLLRIPLGCFVDICVEDQTMQTLFTQDVKKQVERLSHSDSATTEFLADFTKDGLKAFLMNAGKEALSGVLPLLPFGGFAKIAFGFLQKVICEN